MRVIAAEMNHSETAFLRQMEGEDTFSLRWWTPRVEVELCGIANWGLQWLMSRPRYSRLSSHLVRAKSNFRRENHIQYGEKWKTVCYS